MSTLTLPEPPATALGDVFLDGFWRQNTGLVVLLGLCPLLAVSGTVTNALGLGLATTGVLAISNLSVSLSRGLLRPEIQATRPLAELENQPQLGAAPKPATDEATGTGSPRVTSSRGSKRWASRTPSRTKRRDPGATNRKRAFSGRIRRLSSGASGKRT